MLPQHILGQDAGRLPTIGAFVGFHQAVPQIRHEFQTVVVHFFRQAPLQHSQEDLAVTVVHIPAERVDEAVRPFLRRATSAVLLRQERQEEALQGNAVGAAGSLHAAHTDAGDGATPPFLPRASPPQLCLGLFFGHPALLHQALCGAFGQETVPDDAVAAQILRHRGVCSASDEESLSEHRGGEGHRERAWVEARVPRAVQNVAQAQGCRVRRHGQRSSHTGRHVKRHERQRRQGGLGRGLSLR